MINNDSQFGSKAGLPPRIGKYEIQGLLGKGASGLVYKGTDPFVRREVAVKIALQLSEDHLHLSGGESAISTFFTEARAAGMLNHPHIVALYDAGMELDLCYIVMEYVDGDTLLPWTRKSGPRLSPDRVVDIIQKCARGLGYSHAKGVLHRDIKPSNIMLTKDGIPKIMDFSIAEVNSQTNETASVAAGSPLYMAPEQVMRQSVGPSADLYALGAVMYQLFTGEPPFFSPHLPALFTAIRNQPAPRLELKRPDLPQEICNIVAKLLAKKALDRYQSGGELATILLREYERMRHSDAQNSRVEGRNSLRGLSFFNDFSDSEINDLLSASQLKTFSTGAVIVTEDEMEASFYVLALGQVEVRKANLLLYPLGKGDCFGEVALSPTTKRSTSVVALSTVLVLKINTSLLDNLPPDSQLRFYKTFTQTLMHRQTMASARLIEATVASHDR